MAVGTEVDEGVIMARSALGHGTDATGCGCAMGAPTKRYAGGVGGGCAPLTALGVRAIEELAWFGAALNRPRRLSRELIAFARGLVPGLLDERLVAEALVAGQVTSGRSADEAGWAWSGHAPQRVIAAAAFATADAPQWPWFLRVHANAREFEGIPREAWWRSADRFAAWAFGVSLPRVRALTARLRAEPCDLGRSFGAESSAVRPSDRWIAPCIRDAGASDAVEALNVLALERAQCAEAER